MKKEVEKKLKEMMSDIFEVDISKINDLSNPDTIEKWDSLQQLNLAMAIEDEFNIKLSPDDITDMLSYKLIKEITLEKIK
tara:strand:+ start:169 stop:408 length:240 start_codon:yes stop_codon:yes gene_type:complete